MSAAFSMGFHVPRSQDHVRFREWAKRKKANAFLCCRYGVTSAGDSRTGTIHLRSFNKSATSRHDFEISSEATPSRVLSGLRPDRLKYSVDVRRAPNKQRNREDLESQSVESDGSEEMIIRRHVEVEIHSELA